MGTGIGPGMVPGPGIGPAMGAGAPGAPGGGGGGGGIQAAPGRPALKVGGRASVASHSCCTVRTRSPHSFWAFSSPAADVALCEGQHAWDGSQGARAAGAR